MLRLQPAHMPGNEGDLPRRHFEPRYDLARAGVPQFFDVFMRNTAEVEAISDIVHVAQEPAKAVGKRAVEIEDDEGVGHWARKGIARPEMTAKFTNREAVAKMRLHA